MLRVFLAHTTNDKQLFEEKGRIIPDSDSLDFFKSVEIQTSDVRSLYRLC